MLIKINKKKVFTTVIALVFCFVCACMPFQIKKARAMSVGVAMAATSLLVSLYCIGMHADSSGTTNFEHVANAIQEQYRHDFVEKNVLDFSDSEADRITVFENTVRAWQEGVIDLSSPAFQSFKQWAYFYSEAKDILFPNYGDNVVAISNGLQLQSLSSNGSILLSNKDTISVVSSGYPNLQFSLSLNSSSAQFFDNHFYFSFNGSKYYLWKRFTGSNISISSGYLFYNRTAVSHSINQYSTPEIYGSWAAFPLNYFSGNGYIDFSSLHLSTISNAEFASSLPDSPVSSSAPSFSLSLDDNEVFNQVKQIADAEIAGNTTEQLLQRAKYLNDMIGQKPQDGSQYINTLDGTKQFDGSAEDTGQAIVDGTISVPDLLQDVGVDTTVQGQVVSDPVTGEAVPELATPVDLSSSVPLVVNPTFEVVFPQVYNPPTSKGGDFSFPLVNYFPFCMPYDAIRILSLFRAAPEAPSISFNINSYFSNIVNFANKDIGEDGDLVKVRGNVMTLDFSPFNTVAAICRFMLYVLFLVGVCFGISNWLHGGE